MAVKFALLALLSNVLASFCDSSAVESAAVANEACLLQKGRSVPDPVGVSTVQSTPPLVPLVEDVIDTTRTVNNSADDALLSTSIYVPTSQPIPLGVNEIVRDKPKPVHLADSDTLLSTSINGGADSPKANADKFAEKKTDKLDDAVEVAVAELEVPADEKGSVDQKPPAVAENPVALQTHEHLGTALVSKVDNAEDVRLSSAEHALRSMPLDGSITTAVMPVVSLESMGVARHFSSVQSLVAGLSCLAGAMLICVMPLICKYW